MPRPTSRQLGAYRDAEAIAARAAADPARERIRLLLAKVNPTDAERAEVEAWQAQQLEAKVARDAESAARAARLKLEADELEARHDLERGPKIAAVRAKRSR